MEDRKYVMGFFTDEKSVISAIKEMESSSWPLHQVHSPVPSQAIASSMKLKKSRLDYFTGLGVLIGFILGFWLVDYTSGQWNLNFGGRPGLELFSKMINGVLFSIVLGVLATILGIIISIILPGIQNVFLYDSKLSGENWAILSSCHKKEQEGLLMLFIKNKGDVKIIE